MANVFGLFEKNPLDVYVTLDTEQSITATKHFEDITAVNIEAADVIADTISGDGANITNVVAADVAGGSAGTVLYQSSPNQTTFTAVGTEGQVLISNGVNAPSWYSLVPAGMISMFAGNYAPNGWVFCDGTAYNSAFPAYAQLFNAIGKAYVPIFPNPSTLFSVPDLRGVFVCMPGLNNSSGMQDGNLAQGAFVGPTYATFAYQSVPLIPHIHTSDYPDNTNKAQNALPGDGSSYYRSGSSQENNTTTAQSATAPNAYTVVNNYVKPVSLGVYYIIKL